MRGVRVHMELGPRLGMGWSEISGHLGAEVSMSENMPVRTI